VFTFYSEGNRVNFYKNKFDNKEEIPLKLSKVGIFKKVLTILPLTGQQK